MDITFLGAVGTVTGSKYLLTINSKKILVDCGLFQGEKELRLRNWQALPVEPKTIDAVLLTHAHIDHSGYLPLLVKQGFVGNIYCTHGTQELCELLLPDSGHLQEEEAYHANQHGYSKHQPALPLYTAEEAQKALPFFTPITYYTKIALFNNITVEFFPAGHIIGASCIRVTYQGQSIVFSGDLGRPHDTVMQAPSFISEMNYLVMESTYGDRLHPTSHPKELLKPLILKTIKRGGSVIIPAFAVGRTQALLHYIALLKKEKSIPADLPVYLDSPMAINSTQILLDHHHEIRLSETDCIDLNSMTHFTNTVDESKELDNDPLLSRPKIIISASGMATGGRILYHLRSYASDKRNLILFSGYQATKTRGADLLSGQKEIKLLGEWVSIEAEVASLTSLSAHADYHDTLNWMRHITNAPTCVFITHGEPAAALSLKEKIEQQFSWQCVIPSYGQTKHLL